jgi:hypothetical protein
MAGTGFHIPGIVLSFLSSGAGSVFYSDIFLSLSGAEALGACSYCAGMTASALPVSRLKCDCGFFS